MNADVWGWVVLACVTGLGCFWIWANNVRPKR